MQCGPLEGPGEAHAGVLLNGVGVGLLAFGAFPCFHGSVGSGIHALGPGQTREEDMMAAAEAETWHPVQESLITSPGSSFTESLQAGISYIDAPMGQMRAIPPAPTPPIGSPVESKERKTYHHEVEFTVHSTDGFKDKCDPGHLFILCVCHHRLRRPVGAAARSHFQASGFT